MNIFAKDPKIDENINLQILRFGLKCISKLNNKKLSDMYVTSNFGQNNYPLLSQ